MKLFHWISGRQEGGYDKLPLVAFDWLPIDAYVIRYREGSYIHPHTDSVTNKKHFRVNVIVKKAESGGEFVCPDAIINTDRVKFFRPDIHEHSVTAIEQGTRYVLSIGWAKK